MQNTHPSSRPHVPALPPHVPPPFARNPIIHGQGAIVVVPPFIHSFMSDRKDRVDTIKVYTVEDLCIGLHELLTPKEAAKNLHEFLANERVREVFTANKQAIDAMSRHYINIRVRRIRPRQDTNKDTPTIPPHRAVHRHPTLPELRAHIEKLEQWLSTYSPGDEPPEFPDCSQERPVFHVVDECSSVPDHVFHKLL